jgi:hypothetical protein
VLSGKLTTFEHLALMENEPHRTAVTVILKGT